MYKALMIEDHKEVETLLKSILIIKIEVIKLKMVMKDYPILDDTIDIIYLTL